MELVIELCEIRPEHLWVIPKVLQQIYQRLVADPPCVAYSFACIVGLSRERYLPLLRRHNLELIGLSRQTALLRKS